MKDSLIRKAVELLRAGRLVAFPTETVYGLGADATNPAAVNRIFAAKGRPATNPLIVHVADAHVAQRFAATWPENAERLAQAFWPGPLTLVLKKRPSIVDEATAGLSTVGLRAPNHPIALALLRELDGPVAAPSANRSMHVSPTQAKHVVDDLRDAVDLILDGGACEVGIESTVLDLSGAKARILRPGGVTREQIERIIGPVEQAHEIVSHETPALSPGQHERHYAPNAPAYRFDAAQRQQLDLTGAAVLSVSESPADYARNLYRRLRELDAARPLVIYVEMPPDEPEWNAIRDRIRRATKPI